MFIRMSAVVFVSMISRGASFVVVRGRAAIATSTTYPLQYRSALYSSAPWSTSSSSSSTPSSNKSEDKNSMVGISDRSAMSKSRTPFRMPRDAEDDSVPKDTSSGIYAWTKLGLLSELVQSVYDDQGLSAPTPVQQLTIPELLREPPQHLAFLAATGSGKTLAYALPLLQMIKSQELFGNDKDDSNTPTMFTASTTKPKRPKILILAPTRELAMQLTSVIKGLCHRVKLSSQSVVGSGDYGKERKALNRRLDVVVATPGRLLKHWHAGNIFFGDVRHVVIDEMDTMLEQGFQSELQELLHPMLYKLKGNVYPGVEAHPGAPRIVLTSATMTQAVSKLINNQPDVTVNAKKHFVSADGKDKAVVTFPKMRVIKAAGLHKAVPRLQQVFVDVGNVDKLSLLVDVVSSSGGQGAGVKQSDTDDSALTIIFCNTVSSARAAQHALAEAGIQSLSYHGELKSQARAENLKRFRSAGSSTEDEPTVIVCTDLAARGLDVPEVDHVVMFDFPLNALDYLHRSGRTARGVSGNRKGNGRVTALVTKRDRVLATAIENAVQRGEALDGLSSRKSDYVTNNESSSNNSDNRSRGGVRNHSKNRGKFDKPIKGRYDDNKGPSKGRYDDNKGPSKGRYDDNNGPSKGRNFKGRGKQGARGKPAETSAENKNNKRKKGRGRTRTLYV